MYYIDTHTHNSDSAFAGEEDAVIRRCLDAGVKIMLQPDVDSREREAMFALCRRWPDVLRPMLGLYPGSVDKDWRREIDLMLEYASEKVVAIGEIGLDYHYGKEFKEEQKEALHWQLEWAAGLGLPVNIHLREATEDFFLTAAPHCPQRAICTLSAEAWKPSGAFRTMANGTWELAAW